MKPAVTIPYSCLLRAQSAKLIQADSRDYGEGPSTAKMRNVAYFSPIASVALRAGESHHACALSKLSYCVTTTRPALGHWRDCDKLRCQRARRCLFPHPCYWNRKQNVGGGAGTGEETLRAAAEADGHRFEPGFGRAVAVLRAHMRREKEFYFTSPRCAGRGSRGPRRENEFLFRHCEEPTGPARSGRPDDRLRDEAIQSLVAQKTGLLHFACNDESGNAPSPYPLPARGRRALSRALVSQVHG